MDYEIISGKRINSKLLYVISEKQLYKFKTLIRNKKYYVCLNEKCKAKVELVNDVCQKPKKIIEHNHGESENLANELKCVNKIKSECLNSSSVLSDMNALSTIKKSFYDVCAR